MEQEAELTDRQLLRIARLIQERMLAVRVSRYRDVINRLDYLASEMDKIRGIQRQMGYAIGHSWYAAAEKVVSNVDRCVRDLPYHISEVTGAIERRVQDTATLRDLLADLRQIKEEFGQLHYDSEAHTLSVTTEPIELEGISLGEFEVVLSLGRLGESRHHSAYRLVAVDPNPAACNDSVTHPHISDGHLCEGDAGAAIQAALANGRLCDFFLLVRSVLTTYNPSSPYVSLSDWQGISCHECGYSMSADDIHWCPSCEEQFCDECMSYCRTCDEGTCRSCLEECAVCGDLICPACRISCPNCERTLCRTCHEESKCPCQDKESDDDSSADSSTDNDEATAGAATGQAVR